MSDEKTHETEPAHSPSIDEGQMATEKQMRDIGADLYLEVRQYTREELDAERKIVLKKIDWIIMPIVRAPFHLYPLHVFKKSIFWSRSELQNISLTDIRSA